jgi:uncharacterized protein (DUF1330 family)
MPHINPTRNQFEALLTKIPDNEPVVMLNLLKFSDSGELYKSYMRAAYPFFVKSGAEILYQGSIIHTFIGDENASEWDRMLLVKYASKISFNNMTTADEYPNDLRAAALADSRLFVCQ